MRALVIVALLHSCSPTPSAPPPQPERWAELKQEIRTRFPDVRHVAIDDAFPLDSNAVLLDVREPSEFDVSRIEGAINAKFEEPADALGADAKSRPIIVYCSVGWRSAIAARKLEEAGFENVVNLEGSIFEWANTDRPLVNSDGPTGVVHGYDEDWGQLVRDEKRWQKGN